jgi:hypothetical protein
VQAAVPAPGPPGDRASTRDRGSEGLRGVDPDPPRGPPRVHWARVAHAAARRSAPPDGGRCSER